MAIVDEFRDVSCPNESDGSINITVTGGTTDVSNGYTYNWMASNGSNLLNQEDLFNLSGGQYSLLSVIDDNGCVFEPNIVIDIYEPPPYEIESTVNDPLCYDESGWVEFTVSGSNTGGYQYTIEDTVNEFVQSNTNEYNPVDTIFLVQGQYSFVFIDSKGCLSENIDIDIEPRYEDCLLIPTLFSPNADGVNDVWEIGGIENYPNAQITVYNRWGQIVFESNSNYNDNRWDGTLRGEPLPFAVYYYTINPINEYGKTYQGGVTIKR